MTRTLIFLTVAIGLLDGGEARRLFRASTSLRSSIGTRGLLPGELRVTPECKEQIREAVETPEKKEVLGRCERERGFVAQAKAKMQQGDEQAAREMVRKSAIECGRYTKSCAEEVVPHVVYQMRAAGWGVSETCQKEIDHAHMDLERVDKAEACQKENQLAPRMMNLLRQDKLEAATEIAEKEALEGCLGITGKDCAGQYAPVIVGQLVEIMKGLPPVLRVMLFRQTGGQKSRSFHSRPAGQPGGFLIEMASR